MSVWRSKSEEQSRSHESRFDENAPHVARHKMPSSRVTEHKLTCTMYQHTPIVTKALSHVPPTNGIATREIATSADFNLSTSSATQPTIQTKSFVYIINALSSHFAPHTHLARRHTHALRPAMYVVASACRMVSELQTPLTE